MRVRYFVIVNKKSSLNDLFKGAVHFVASPGIEPGSGASEALILSIVLRGHLF